MSSRRALVCALGLPEFDRESGSQRVLDSIDLLRGAGCAVTFLAERASGEERYAQMLQQRGVPVYQGFDSEVTRLFRYGNFDVAIFCSWHVAEAQIGALREVSPQTKVIVDAPDLNWLRNLRKSLLNRRDRTPDEVPDFPWLMLRELDTYLAADVVMTVSDREARIINDLLGDEVVTHTVPDIEDLAPSSLPFGKRRGIVFVGNFRHEPNQDAASFFCEEVLPHLSPKLLEKHPVHVIGNEPEHGALMNGQSPFVRLVGWVPSLAPYLASARVSVVPLRYGAGTKRKLLQALGAGTPVVSTSIGVEGLNLTHERHVLVADDAESFAHSIELLIKDEQMWGRLAQEGAAQIGGVHGRNAVRARFFEAVG